MVCMYDEIDDRESDKIEKEETKKGAGKMVERTKVNNNVSSLKIGTISTTFKDVTTKQIKINFTASQVTKSMIAKQVVC